MLSQLEEGGFYRTINGSTGYVLVEEDDEGHAALVLLCGQADDGHAEWEPGDIWYLDAAGAVLDAPDNTAHPLCAIQRLAIKIDDHSDWRPLPAREGVGYDAAHRQLQDALVAIGTILQRCAHHVPPMAEAGRCYLTLNRSTVYVADVDTDGGALAILLKGGIADRLPGYSYRLAADGTVAAGLSLAACADFMLTLDHVLEGSLAARATQNIPAREREDTVMVDAISAILRNADPIGISFASPYEYELEARTIARRLVGSMSREAIQTVVFEEFVVWFDEGAGSRDRYRGLAEAIMKLQSARASTGS